MRRIALLAVLAAALAAVPAAAAPKPAIRLKIGDVVDVIGTKVLCVAITSSGKDGVACVLWGKDKPLVGTYGVGLAQDGTAVLNRLKADGTGATIAKRRAQSTAASDKVYRVRVGDSFGFPLTATVNLGCRVIDVTSTAVEAIYRGVKVSCWQATTTAPIPRTWGVSINDRMAGLFRFDAQGKVSPEGIVRKQPR